MKLSLWKLKNSLSNHLERQSKSVKKKSIPEEIGVKIFMKRFEQLSINQGMAEIADQWHVSLKSHLIYQRVY